MVAALASGAVRDGIRGGVIHLQAGPVKVKIA
jgi:hypothetical protein